MRTWSWDRVDNKRLTTVLKIKRRASRWSQKGGRGGDCSCSLFRSDDSARVVYSLRARPLPLVSRFANSREGVRDSRMVGNSKDARVTVKRLSLRISLNRLEMSRRRSTSQEVRDCQDNIPQGSFVAEKGMVADTVTSICFESCEENDCRCQR